MSTRNHLESGIVADTYASCRNDAILAFCISIGRPDLELSIERIESDVGSFLGGYVHRVRKSAARSPKGKEEENSKALFKVPSVANIQRWHPSKPNDNGASCVPRVSGRYTPALSLSRISDTRSFADATFIPSPRYRGHSSGLSLTFRFGITRQYGEGSSCMYCQNSTQRTVSAMRGSVRWRCSEQCSGRARD